MRSKAQEEGSAAALLRALPSVQRLLEAPLAAELCARYGRIAVVTALRTTLQAAREAAAEGVVAIADTLVHDAARMLEQGARPALRPVINATGVLLHTNLGRAPLAAEAVEAMASVASGYCNLEFALEAGSRGSRLQGIEALLRTLTGAEAALAVNNGAAAVLLALSALAADAEVIVSRGELVEIGGGFRIPDVIRQGGARLVEVGTTNRTRLADYANAITPATRVLLKVHQSNYRITGFVGAVSVGELASLGRSRGLIVMEDLGSGSLADLARLGRSPEPTVREAVQAGADLVAFSGDKLLGGPQSGILVGAEAAIAPLRRHPLLRAVRLDKVTLAALEATLRLHQDPARAASHVPLLRMLGQSEAVVRARAERLAALLGDADVRKAVSVGRVGGGALPDESLPSWSVSLSAANGADALARRLRLGEPAIVARIADGRVLLDLLAVADEEVALLAAAVRAAL